MGVPNKIFDDVADLRGGVQYFDTIFLAVSAQGGRSGESTEGERGNPKSDMCIRLLFRQANVKQWDQLYSRSALKGHRQDKVGAKVSVRLSQSIFGSLTSHWSTAIRRKAVCLRSNLPNSSRHRGSD